jgi:hypothetical protein
MKKLFKLFIGIFVLSSLFIGCSDDDDQDKNNELKVENAVYDLEDGLLINAGEDEGTMEIEWDGYWYMLALASFSTDTENVPAGQQVIVFNLFSSNATALDSGDYTFDLTSPFAVKTFTTSGYSVNFDPDIEPEDPDDIMENMVLIVSGTVSVSKNGTTYEIDANCKDINGKTVKAYYKGTLGYFDFEDWMTDSRMTPTFAKTLMKGKK